MCPQSHQEARDLEEFREEVIVGLGLDRDHRFRTSPAEFANALVQRRVLAISPNGW